MKISELTENDVIHIRNKKEAKGIAELCEGWFNPALKEYGNIAVNRAFEKYGSETCIKKNIASGYNNETYVTYGSVAHYSQNGNNIIPATKFLKPSTPSKKDLQEALSKVGEELSSMNERLKALEQINAIQPIDLQPHFDEVTERLPEKWCVKAGDKTELELIYNKVCSQPEAKELSYYYHFPATDNDFCWAHSSIHRGYEEITFETFKKYVLKEEVKEAVELEVGKWYKSSFTNGLDIENKSIFCITKTKHGGSIIAFGFDFYGLWFGEQEIHNPTIDYFAPATESEVFEALKAEAEKRGFKEGAVFTDKDTRIHVKVLDSSTWFYSKKTNMLHVTIPEYQWLLNNNVSNPIIFNNGKWATIISQPEAIDFSKAGQLVANEDGIVVMITGNGITLGTDNPQLFSGVCVNYLSKPIGSFSTQWIKDAFKLYEGELTLKND